MFFNLLKPYSVTSHCALRSKDSLCMIACGFYISRKGGAGEVGGVTRRVTCTWWLLGLAVRTSAPPLSLTAWTGYRKHYSHFVGSLWQGRLLGLWVGVWQPIVLTIACLSGHGRGHRSAYWSGLLLREQLKSFDIHEGMWVATRPAVSQLQSHTQQSQNIKVDTTSFNHVWGTRHTEEYYCMLSL